MITLQGTTLFRFGQRAGFVSAGVGYLFQDVSDRDKREIRKLCGQPELDFIVHDKEHPDRMSFGIVRRPQQPA